MDCCTIHSPGRRNWTAIIVLSSPIKFALGSTHMQLHSLPNKPRTLGLQLGVPKLDTWCRSRESKRTIIVRDASFVPRTKQSEAMD